MIVLGLVISILSGIIIYQSTITQIKNGEEIDGAAIGFLSGFLSSVIVSIIIHAKLSAFVNANKKNNIKKQRQKQLKEELRRFFNFFWLGFVSNIVFWFFIGIAFSNIST